MCHNTVAGNRTKEVMELICMIFISFRKIPDTSVSANRDCSSSPPQQPPPGAYSQVSTAETSLFSWTPPLLSSVPHGKPSYFTAFLLKKIYMLEFHAKEFKSLVVL
jgi:hypothetical protein